MFHKILSCISLLLIAGAAAAETRTWYWEQERDLLEQRVPRGRTLGRISWTR